MLEKIKELLKKKFLHEVGFVYAGSLLNGASLFLINIILGRILARDLFGIFSLAVLALSTVAEMSDMGLNGALLRFAPYYLANKQLDKLKQLVKIVWKWRVGLTLILTFGGMALSTTIARYIFNRPEVSPYLIVSFLGIGGVVLGGFTNTYLQASQRFFTNSLFQSLKGLLRLFLILLAWWLGIQSLYLYLAIYILVPWVLFGFSYWYLPAGFRGATVELEVREKMRSQISKFSFWLALWSLSAILASRVDQIMLSNLLGLDKVAVFSMAFQFVYIYSLALQSITSVIIPKISALTTSAQLWSFCGRLYRWIVPAVILLAILIYPSQYIIRFVFGYKYIESVPIYLLLSYFMLINFLAIPFSVIITVYNRTKLVALAGFLGLIVSFAANFYLIPRFGVAGAAYSFGLSLLVSFVYNFVSAMYLLKNKQIEVV